MSLNAEGVGAETGQRSSNSLKPRRGRAVVGGSGRSALRAARSAIISFQLLRFWLSTTHLSWLLTDGARCSPRTSEAPFRPLFADQRSSGYGGWHPQIQLQPPAACKGVAKPHHRRLRCQQSCSWSVFAVGTYRACCPFGCVRSQHCESLGTLATGACTSLFH